MMFITLLKKYKTIFTKFLMKFFFNLRNNFMLLYVLLSANIWFYLYIFFYLGVKLIQILIRNHNYVTSLDFFSMKILR